MANTEAIGKVRIADHEDAGAVVLRPDDAIFDHSASDRVRGELEEGCRRFMAEGRTLFIIDLSSVMVIDSSGLSVLISVFKLVQQQGAKLSLVVPAPVVRHFVVTKLVQVFPIHADVHDALDEA